MNVYDRVKAFATVNGTQTATVAGPLPSFRGFDVVPNGTTVPYVIVGGAEWETGRGTYDNGLLFRDFVYSSSANGAKVSFTPGTKQIFITASAGYIQETFDGYQEQIDVIVEQGQELIDDLEADVATIVANEVEQAIIDGITEKMDKSANLSDVDDMPTAKVNLGINNVDNTSDANKPVSSATSTALGTKQDTITGAATTITGSDLTASRVLSSDASGKVAASTITTTQLGTLSTISSNVQTQLDGKALSSHNHTIANVTDLQTQLDAKAARATPMLASVITGSTAAVAGTRYYFNTTGTITLTLPASASAGSVVGIVNHTSTSCVIARNGHRIMRLAENLIVDSANVGFDLVYTNATIGWVIT